MIYKVFTCIFHFSSLFLSSNMLSYLVVVVVLVCVGMSTVGCNMKFRYFRKARWCNGKNSSLGSWMNLGWILLLYFIFLATRIISVAFISSCKLRVSNLFELDIGLNVTMGKKAYNRNSINAAFSPTSDVKWQKWSTFIFRIPICKCHVFFILLHFVLA